jgi:hypothetical protein
MTSLGELVVKFSTPMKTEYIDLGWINSTYIDLYIIPSESRDNDDGFRLNSVNFTWNVTDYKEFNKDSSQMIFKLVFNEPLQISPLKTQDMLILNIKDKQSFFISETLGKDLDDKYTILTTKVKRQMEDSAFTQNF